MKNKYVMVFRIQESFDFRGADFFVSQVSVALTQNRHQGSKLLSTLDPSQGLKVSQVILPCDSQGSIDFSNYPFQVSRDL